MELTRVLSLSSHLEGNAVYKQVAEQTGSSV